MFAKSVDLCLVTRRDCHLAARFSTYISQERIPHFGVSGVQTMTLSALRVAVCLTLLTAVPPSLGDTPGIGLPAFGPSLVYSQVPPGYWQPGGAEGRVGSPYYYRPTTLPYGFYGFEGGGLAAFGDQGPDSWHGAPAWGGHLPQAPASFTYPTDPYTYHFGPGYYRYAERGHFRFPYYNYRRPWYFQGPPSFNRDTNFAW